MYYELYIDLLFLENFVMDTLLLFAVRTVLKFPVNAGRIFLGGAVGSALTCLVIMLPVSPLLKYLMFCTAVSAVMLKTGTGVSRTAEFLHAYIVLYVCGILMGGILTACRPYIRNMSLYFMIAAGSCYSIRIFWRFFCCLKEENRKICTVTLYEKGKTYRLRALLDTGNLLEDEISGEPVCVLECRLAERVVGKPENAESFHYIPYRTVEGEGVMQVFRIEKMCMHLEKERWIICPVIGVGRDKLSARGEFEMIINPGILGGEYDDCKSSSPTTI